MLTSRKQAKVAYQIHKDLCLNNFLLFALNPPTSTLKNQPNKQRWKLKAEIGAQTRSVRQKTRQKLLITLLFMNFSAIRHFKAHFLDLKWTTVNDWKEAMVKVTTNPARDVQLEEIIVLEKKKRGRPCLLPDSVTADIKCYIRALSMKRG